MFVTTLKERAKEALEAKAKKQQPERGPAADVVTVS
jgi:hypothetical protein